MPLDRCRGCGLLLSPHDSEIMGVGCAGCYAEQQRMREALRVISLLGLTLSPDCGELSREAFYYNQLCRAISLAANARSGS